MTTSTLTGPAAPARHPHRTLRPAHRAPAATAPPGRRDPHHPGARRDRQPPPHRWFADRLLDVLAGRHPVTRMLGHTCGENTYDRLWDLAARGTLRPEAGRPTPQVRRCGYGTPAPGVLEAYALIGCGDALRALAFRLERGSDHRWRCAAVECAGPAW